jgi:hypothetical protein
MDGHPGEPMGSSLPSGVESVRAAVRRVPGVDAVELVGSGAAGDRTPLSDWDFEVDIENDGVLHALEHALQVLPVLAVFWDPLSDRANLVVILNGPIKVDVIVPGQPNPRPVPHWMATADTLPQIDEHFWDWTLWLGAKQLRGKVDLVEGELAKMWDALLQPLGTRTPPASTAEAVSAYLVARGERQHELGVQLDRRLEHQVRRALMDHGVLPRP